MTTLQCFAICCTIVLCTLGLIAEMRACANDIKEDMDS